MRAAAGEQAEQALAQSRAEAQSALAGAQAEGDADPRNRARAGRPAAQRHRRGGPWLARRRRGAGAAADRARTRAGRGAGAADPRQGARRRARDRRRGARRRARGARRRHRALAQPARAVRLAAQQRRSPAARRAPGARRAHGAPGSGGTGRRRATLPGAARARATTRTATCPATIWTSRSSSPRGESTPSAGRLAGEDDVAVQAEEILARGRQSAQVRGPRLDLLVGRRRRRSRRGARSDERCMTAGRPGDRGSHRSRSG